MTASGDLEVHVRNHVTEVARRASQVATESEAEGPDFRLLQGLVATAAGRGMVVRHLMWDRQEGRVTVSLIIAERTGDDEVARAVVQTMAADFGTVVERSWSTALVSTGWGTLILSAGP